MKRVRFTSTKRHYFVGPHALDRLIERADARSVVDALGYNGFCDFVVRAVRQSEAAGHVKDVLDRGVPARVVDLAPAFPGVYALIRPNDVQSGPSEAIASVLTADHVERALSHGRWRVPQSQFGTKLLSALKQHGRRKS